NPGIPGASTRTDGPEGADGPVDDGGNPGAPGAPEERVTGVLLQPATSARTTITTVNCKVFAIMNTLIKNAV
ncbi:MAG: hypothetical protein OXE03_02935, partial [Gammaproteobacteria bacterium]|nr:hypothetical protein [Gammaproteobacteria bacterium]